jgi:hypothetical protein
MMIATEDLPALRDALRGNQRLLALVRQLVDGP